MKQEEKINNYQSEVSSASLRHIQLEGRVTSLQRELKAAEGEVTRFSALLTSSKHLQQDLLSAKEEELGRNEVQSRELSLTRLTCQELVRNIASKDVEITQLHDKMIDTQRRNEEVVSSKDARLSLLKKDIDRLLMQQEDMQAKMQQVTMIDAMLRDTRASLDTRNDEMRKLKKFIKQVNEDKKSKESKMEELEDDLKTSKNDLSSLQKLITEVASNYSLAEEELTKLKGNLEEKEKELENCQITISSQEEKQKVTQKMLIKAKKYIVKGEEEKTINNQRMEMSLMQAEDLLCVAVVIKMNEEKAKGYARLLEEQLFQARRYEKSMQSPSRSALDNFGDISDSGPYYPDSLRATRMNTAGTQGMHKVDEEDYAEGSLIDGLQVGFNDDGASTRMSSPTANVVPSKKFFSESFAADMFGESSSFAELASIKPSYHIGGGRLAEDKITALISSLEAKLKAVDNTAESLKYLADQAEAIERIQATAALNALQPGSASQSNMNGSRLGSRSERVGNSRVGSAVTDNEEEAKRKDKEFFINQHAYADKLFAEMQKSLESLQNDIDVQKENVVQLQRMRAQGKAQISSWKKKFKKMKGRDPDPSDKEKYISELIEQVDSQRDEILTIKAESLSLNAKAIAMQTELYHLNEDLEENAKEFLKKFNEPITIYLPNHHEYIPQVVPFEFESSLDDADLLLESKADNPNSTDDTAQLESTEPVEGEDLNDNSLVAASVAESIANDNIDESSIGNDDASRSDIDSLYQTKSPISRKKSKRKKEKKLKKGKSSKNRKNEDEDESEKAIEMQAKKSIVPSKPSEMALHSNGSMSTISINSGHKLAEESISELDKQVTGSRSGDDSESLHQREERVGSNPNMRTLYSMISKERQQSGESGKKHSILAQTSSNSQRDSQNRELMQMTRSAREHLSQLKSALDALTTKIETELEEIQFLLSQRNEVREEIYVWIINFEELCGYAPEHIDKVRSKHFHPLAEKFGVVQDNIGKKLQDADELIGMANNKSVELQSYQQEYRSLLGEAAVNKYSSREAIPQLPQVEWEDPYHVNMSDMTEVSNAELYSLTGEENFSNNNNNNAELDDFNYRLQEEDQPDDSKYQQQSNFDFKGDHIENRNDFSEKNSISFIENGQPVPRSNPITRQSSNNVEDRSIAFIEDGIDVSEKLVLVESSIEATADRLNTAEMNTYRARSRTNSYEVVERARSESPMFIAASDAVAGVIRKSIINVATSNTSASEDVNSSGYEEKYEVDEATTYNGTLEISKTVLSYPELKKEYSALKKELKKWKNVFKSTHNREPTTEDYHLIELPIKHKLARKNELKILMGDTKGETQCESDHDTVSSPLIAVEEVQTRNFSPFMSEKRSDERVEHFPEPTSTRQGVAMREAKDSTIDKYEKNDMTEEKDDSVDIVDLAAEYKALKKELKLWKAEFVNKNKREPLPTDPLDTEIKRKLIRRNDLKKLLSTMGESSDSDSSEKMLSSYGSKKNSTASMRISDEESSSGSNPPQGPRRSSSYNNSAIYLMPSIDENHHDDDDEARNYRGTEQFSNTRNRYYNDKDNDAARPVEVASSSTAFRSKKEASENMSVASAQELSKEYSSLKKELKSWKKMFIKENGREPGNDDFYQLDEDIQRKLARKNYLKKALNSSD